MNIPLEIAMYILRQMSQLEACRFRHLSRVFKTLIDKMAPTLASTGAEIAFRMRLSSCESLHYLVNVLGYKVSPDDIKSCIRGGGKATANFLEAKFGPYCFSIMGALPMMLTHDNEEMVEVLLEEKVIADISAVMISAAKNNAIRTVRFLIQHGPIPRKAVIAAIEYGHFEIYEMLATTPTYEDLRMAIAHDRLKILDFVIQRVKIEDEYIEDVMQEDTSIPVLEILVKKHITRHSNTHLVRRIFDYSCQHCIYSVFQHLKEAGFRFKVTTYPRSISDDFAFAKELIFYSDKGMQKRLVKMIKASSSRMVALYEYVGLELTMRSIESLVKYSLKRSETERALWLTCLIKSNGARERINAMILEWFQNKSLTPFPIEDVWPYRVAI